MDELHEFVMTCGDLVLGDWMIDEENRCVSPTGISLHELCGESSLDNAHTQLQTRVETSHNAVKDESGKYTMENDHSHNIAASDCPQICATNISVNAFYTDTQGSKSEENPAASTLTRARMTLSLQRTRNRECMQRFRRRKHEKLQQMKETLQQLTIQYQRLHDEFEQQSFVLSRDNSRSEARRTLEAQYVALSHLLNCLQEDNFRLENLVSQKQLFTQSVKQILVDFDMKPRQSELLHSGPTEAGFDFDFVPLTEKEANARIQKSYRRISRLEATAIPFPNKIMGGLSLHEEMPTPAATFGWDISCQITDDNEFFGCFSKFLPGATAQSVMQNTWSSYLYPGKKMFVCRPIVRDQVLQVLNGSTLVMGRDLVHPIKPGKIMRAIRLAAFIEIENGFALSLTTLNPTSSAARTFAQQHTCIEYVDSTVWTEFCTHRDENTGVEGCMVKFFMCTSYDTQEDSYLRLLNVLKGMTIWEAGIVPSYVKVLLS